MSKTIRTSNNLTIDAVGDIILDADNADVKLQDGGTEFGRISRITSDLVIKSMGNNQDIILKGLDDSATINALTLDMSEGGNATFSGNVTATDITANSLTTNVISSNGSNAELSLQASGTGDVLISALRVNGTTLDSSDSTKITIAENVDVTGTLAVTGAVTLDGVTITDNTISTNASNADLEISANGTGDVLLGTLRFRRDGTGGLANVIESDDSTTITINDALEVTGATDIGGALTGTSASFSTTLGVTGVTTLSGTAVIDNLTINDNIISSSSNADIILTPGGTGNIVAGALTINGTTLSAADSTKITLAEAVDVTGVASFGSTVSLDGSGDLITNDNRIAFANSGTVSFMDFTVTQFGQDNNTVLSSVKSINMFLDSNGGDTGQAFRIFNNTNPDSSPTETTYIFKVDESGDLFVTGDTTMTGDLTATDITANSLTTNVISSNGSNAELSLQASGTGDVLISALRVNGTTLDSADSTKITIAENVNVTGTLTSRGNIFGVQRLTGSGSTEVVNLTDTVTLLITTGTQNFSLANGTEGQIKIISMVTDGGAGTVTPASFVNGTSITFDDVEDTITLLYQSTGWVVLARQNAVVNA